MKLQGTAHSDGSYTVMAEGPRWFRRLSLALFALGYKDRIKIRTERYIAFTPPKGD